ncbi:Uncharacterised protein [uncultured archaeon]|nr:Uncharacterised protein [uncultured archaeon]
MLHGLLLAGKIIAGSIAGLVAMGLVMTSIRAAVEGHFDIEKPFTAEDEAHAEQRASRESYLHRVLVAFDQFINVLAFNGMPGETISAHAYRAKLKGHLWGRAMNRWLEWIQPDHGAKAASGDHYRAITVAAIEKKILP